MTSPDKGGAGVVVQTAISGGETIELEKQVRGRENAYDSMTHRSNWCI
jgi:hypothetical protein